MMRVTYILGSPRPTGGHTKTLLETLDAEIKTPHQSAFFAPQSAEPAEVVASIETSDALVLGAPLYIDSVPANALALLEQIAAPLKESGTGARVYAVFNCGFYEPQQNLIALDIVRNWAERARLDWGRGAALGGGEMLGFAPPGQGPTMPFLAALQQLAHSIESGEIGAEPILAKPGMPRWMYKFGGSMGWVSDARKNKLKKKQLYKQIGYNKGEDQNQQ